MRFQCHQLNILARSNISFCRNVATDTFFPMSLGWIKQEEVMLSVTLMADVAICRWWSLRRVLSLSVKYDAANWCKISRETTELFPLPSDFCSASVCPRRSWVTPLLGKDTCRNQTMRWKYVRRQCSSKWQWVLVVLSKCTNIYLSSFSRIC